MPFPLPLVPQASYKKGAHKRWFGAVRDGGRLHAACDLLAAQGTDVLAIEDGVVVEESKFFYHGTNSVTVLHTSGILVRYGEIDPKSEIIPSGTPVKAGQRIAVVGKMIKDSMLHFELYSGAAKGPLTQPKNPPYQRRSDLIDPTALLDRLAAELLSKGRGRS